MRISDWSSDVCSSDLAGAQEPRLEMQPQFRAAAGDSRELVLDRPPDRRVQLAGDDHRAVPGGRGVEPGERTQQGQGSEARRGGKEWVSTCRSRWAPYP